MVARGVEFDIFQDQANTRALPTGLSSHALPEHSKQEYRVLKQGLHHNPSRPHVRMGISHAPSQIETGFLSMGDGKVAPVVG
jgi:hypothetical protein